MCGIVGYYSLDPNERAAKVIYDSLLVLQHRGQDAAGIATFDESFRLVKELGLIRDVFNEKSIQRLHRILPRGDLMHLDNYLHISEE